MIIILVVTKQIPSQTDASIDKYLDQHLGCEGLKLCQYATVFILTSLSCEYWLSYGNWNSTGLKILAAR